MNLEGQADAQFITERNTVGKRDFKLVNPEKIAKLQRGPDNVWRLDDMTAEEYNAMYDGNDNSDMYKKD